MSNSSMDPSSIAHFIVLVILGLRLTAAVWLAYTFKKTRDWRVVPLALGLIVSAAAGAYVHSNHLDSGVPLPLYPMVAFLPFELLILISVVAVGRLADAFQEQRQNYGPLSQVVENDRDAIGIADLDGTVTHLNGAGLEMFGWNSIREVRGRKLDEFLVSEFRDKFRSDLLRKVTQGEHVSGVNHIQNSQTGERREVEFQIFPLRDPKTHRPRGIGWEFRDISDRRKAEIERDRLAGVVEDFTDAVILLDTNGIIEGWNSAAERLYGYSKEEAKGKPISTLVPQDRMEEVRDIISRLRRDEPVDHFRTVRLRKDGTPVDVSISASPFRDEKGEVNGLVSMSRDISEWTRMEAALREGEARFRLAFENAPTGITLVDSNANFLSVNRAFCHMLGYTEKELLQKSVLDVTHPDDVGIDSELTGQLFRGEIRTFQIEKRYRTKKGEVVWGNLSAAVLREQDGKPLYEIGLIEDVTEKKKARQELEQSRRLSEQRLVELEQLYQTAPVGLP